MPSPTPLKRAIFEAGVTQRSVAVAADIREDLFSRIVNGFQCDEATRERIAAALGRPVADLFAPDAAEAA